MKTKVLLGVVMFAVFSLNGTAQAKEKRFGLEFNTGVSLATKKIDNASLNTGFGFEGVLHYRIMPHLGLYGGWGWNRFGAENTSAGNEICFEETGYVFGLNFKHPVGSSKLSYYVRAGGLYNHIETENPDGDIINDTRHGLGFQLAGGVSINLGSDWSFNPGLKFNSLTRNIKAEGISKQIDYQYISARIGFEKRF
jgi:hypothetical protein